MKNSLPLGWSQHTLVELQAKKKWALNGGPFGSNLVQRDYVDSGIPVIRGANISGKAKFNKNDFVYVSEKKADELKANNAYPGDVVFTQRGTLGQVGLIPKQSSFPRYVISQSQMKMTVDESQVLPEWIYYYFSTPFTITELVNKAFSSGVPHINLRILREFQVPVPPLPTQQKITGILSVYDDLIENNLRRIKILEEMAQNLYHEWFVKFRFPGHQNAFFIDSHLGKIPEGWEVQRLDELCSAVLDGDWIETKDQGGDDFRLLQISNIGLGDFVETNKFRYVTQETFDRLHCTEIRPDDLLIARMPNPIGRGWLVRKMPWRMITAVDVAIARADARRIDPIFLLHFWNQPSTLDAIEKQSSGTTRLRITRRVLCAMPIPTPPLDMQKEFSSNARPMFDLCNVLRDKISSLRRNRDLLLPRLISGEMDVSKLDITVPEEDDE